MSTSKPDDTELDLFEWTQKNFGKRRKPFARLDDESNNALRKTGVRINSKLRFGATIQDRMGDKNG